MGNLSDLFNAGASNVGPKSFVDPDVYSVSYKNGKNGIYKAIIRFVPFYADPINKSTVYKKSSSVVNPLTGAKLYVDNPVCVGQPSPISDMFGRLWSTGIESYKEAAKKFLSSKDQYASLVQIIEDEQHPELKGKIMVFRYGKKLYDKIQDEQKPKGYAPGYNPFHPATGRYFSLVVTAQQEFNNYDQSSFFDYKDQSGNPVPMGMWYVNPATNQTEVVTENTDLQGLMDYLVANSPDLTKQEFRPWTDDQAKFVTEAIQAIGQYVQNGTMQQGFQTATAPMANPMGQLQVNAAPTFPGAVQPAAPAMGMPAPSMPAPAAPAMGMPAPSMPAPAAPAAPATPGFGPINLGAGSVPQGGASVSGVVLPNAAPATPQPAAPAAPKGLGIDMSKICEGL